MTAMQRVIPAALALAVAAWAAPGWADSVSDFYKGKRLNLYVGSPPGGGYDTYARSVSGFWKEHIPGKPTIVVVNMPGAASLKMTNFVSNVAPKDGTAIGAPQNIIPFEGLLHLLSKKGEKAKFDAQKINWIGSASRDVYLVIAWHTSKAKTFEDLKKREFITGSAGKNTEHSTTANLWNKMFGTKIKAVTGYRGGKGVMLALERGEVEGISGRGYSSLMSRNANWVRDKKIRILLQFGMQPHPDLKNVPFALDLAKTPEDRKVLEFICTKYDILRLYFAPAGVPQDRVAALRASFNATMKDPKFLARAKKSRLEVDPVDGKKVQAMIKALYDTPKPLVERARNLLLGN